ncbi:FO synthase [Rhodococcus opacus M213]|uniref:FO synthase n=1 Tax=Rhodococcus opacus M213 TaxID=1129896 RepID=K8XJP3_RHOOP|nr:bifunctional FO biosynthesis protein CofGH [Rhodococcus opacus]EKT77300.1 FO synthase [Rhodococcus opacus M213]
MVDGALRRVLARAEGGKTLNVTEVELLLAARGEDLARLTVAASRVRDAAMASAGRPGTVTYSPKVFIPVTRLCRDRCHYCTFATVPHRLSAPYLSMDEIVAIAREGAERGCTEALFTLGDRPEDRWDVARIWLDEHGYADTLSYVRAAAIRVLEETGLLPHLNPGVLSWSELTRLKPVAPSMGMMLETTARRLWSDRGGPHFGSPDKDPEVRLRVLEDAGRVSVPFTTGILVGIGETLEERAESILAIRRISREYGHVQEVIVQNFLAKPRTAMDRSTEVEFEEYRATIAVTRIVLGPGVSLQAPPNLSDPESLPELLAAGIDDWGGISAVTVDHVNPERPWPKIELLRRAAQAADLNLAPRLTAHPKYVRDAMSGSGRWIDPRLHNHIRALCDSATFLADPAAHPVGLPWQDPDGGLSEHGRVDLHSTIDTEGRTTDRRGDFDQIFGGWSEVADRAQHTAAGPTTTSDFAAAFRAAERDPAGLTDEQYLTLMTAEGRSLDAVASLADDLRKSAVGEDVTYVVNRNINFTNVCYVGCRFCAFAQRRTDDDAYTLSLDQIADRVREASALGATEVCMQGGIDPNLSSSDYADIIRTAKQAAPGMHIHAFSPMEIATASAKANVPVRDWLMQMKDAGLDTIPGTAAEILDDDVRWVLTKGKLPASEWIRIVETAHELGIRSSSTMMYGHVDNPGHWVGHLRTLRDLQDRTGGFTEFVPLPFVHLNAPIYLAGLARPGPTMRDNRAVHAVARIMLHGRIHHIQTSWVKLGIEGTRVMLRSGANDLGGTLMEETISRMAGSEHGSNKTVSELAEIADGIGRPTRQRTTDYRTDAVALSQAAG